MTSMPSSTGLAKFSEHLMAAFCTDLSSSPRLKTVAQLTLVPKME